MFFLIFKPINSYCLVILFAFWLQSVLSCDSKKKMLFCICISIPSLLHKFDCLRGLQELNMVNYSNILTLIISSSFQFFSYCLFSQFSIYSFIIKNINSKSISKLSITDQSLKIKLIKVSQKQHQFSCVLIFYKLRFDVSNDQIINYKKMSQLVYTQEIYDSHNFLNPSNKKIKNSFKSKSKREQADSCIRYQRANNSNILPSDLDDSWNQIKIAELPTVTSQLFKKNKDGQALNVGSTTNPNIQNQLIEKLVQKNNKLQRQVAVKNQMVNELTTKCQQLEQKIQFSSTFSEISHSRSSSTPRNSLSINQFTSRLQIRSQLIDIRKRLNQLKLPRVNQNLKLFYENDSNMK